MFKKLEEVEARFEELSRILSDPEVLADQSQFQKYAREHGEISPLVTAYRSYVEVSRELEDNKELLSDPDPEMKEMAREEIKSLSAEKEKLEVELQQLLIPKDPRDDKNVIMEIRAGTGGEEAALFAADLFRAYSRYAERQGWKISLIDESLADAGGFKEVIVSISGNKVFSRMKHESGVHRVQRVPKTETQGRIHTSAVTVAILPEAEEVDVEINPSEIRVDVFRSSGCGGQSVNTTDSAVRITHIPTGIIASCQDEKSQHKNRAKALVVLRSRILAKKVEAHDAEISKDRKSQVGSGDRSEKIRTYNFPQSRVTDHRVGLTLHKLDQIMDGDLNEILDAMAAYFQAEELKSGNRE
ncbi:MAG: peptide chain release factor 1 [Proteobacteria bacterium]|nr:peptide chain release factor 1 [Pseudomonadota bacterium]